MSTVALVGAGGKMGCRITDNMKKQTAYRMLHVEVAPAGLANLAKRGVAAVARPRRCPRPTSSSSPCPTTVSRPSRPRWCPS